HTSYTTRNSAAAVAIHTVAWGGPAGRPPVVMLHGIWDTWRIFERLAMRLAAERTIYTLDLRGHGDSDKPADGYALGDYAADVHDVLDQLGHEQFVLLGFSLGALVATQLVADQPERVARLILEDPPYSPDADPRGRAAWLGTLLEIKQLPFEEVVEELSDLYPTRDRATNELSARALINTADGPFRALRDSGISLDIPAILARYAQPTLILRADPQYGGALNERGRDELLAARPDAQVVEFPGTGHLIHVEREEAFTAAVEAFLRA
ncbi:MAG TPA: alpha/beta hydrolase, partial [Thermomicrobiales bacterium]